jgi:alpha-1,2-mannosyltransferase
VRAIATVAACWGGAAIILPAQSRQYFLHTVFDVTRPGSPAFFSNTTINGVIARMHGPSWLWIPFGLAFGVIGLGRALKAHNSGNEIAAIVLVGLTTLLIAPTSWLASAVWIAPAIGVILGDATSRRRVWGAATVLVLFWARVQMLGEKIVRHHVPFIGTTLQGFYAYVLAVLIFMLPTVEQPETNADSTSPRRSRTELEMA